MSAIPTLALRAVSKSFGMTAALADMTLELFPGEVHAIVGENGAGKSTMIKIMTGIYQPSSGQVEIDGAPVVLSGSKAARLRGVAAIYQEPMVFPDLDVTENIFISATDAGLVLDRRSMRRRAEALIDRIGMTLDVDREARGLTLARPQQWFSSKSKYFHWKSICRCKCKRRCENSCNKEKCSCSN